jgi:hypothetical protein
MRPIVVSKTGEGSSSIVPMDTYQNPFNVTIKVVVSGTVTYTVQSTNDDIQNAAVTPSWDNHPTLAGLTIAGLGNYAFPVTGIRLNITAGAGTATMTVQQAGMPGRG